LILFSSLPALGSSSSLCSTASLAIICEGNAMTFDYILGSIVTVAVTAYLVYVLIRPERF
jgi:K+-transporting ATPase KdpF subunit